MKTNLLYSYNSDDATNIITVFDKHITEITELNYRERFQPNFLFVLSMTEPDLGQIIAYKKKHVSKRLKWDGSRHKFNL